MENAAATQLPEVDALPDGFVDGTAEPLCPPTPNNEEEKPRSDIRINGRNRLDGLAHEVVDLNGKGDVEKDFGSPLMPGLAHSTHEDSSEVSGSCEVKEQAEEKFQSSDKSAEDKLVAQPIHAKEKSLPDGEDSLKNRKQETSEAKKNAKRSFKSEKEVLQFTLKYQQVLAERDAAIAVRDKLESLCRELQRQNKMLMDECKRVSTEGQNLRLDLSAKFQDAIKEVSSKLEQQKDECISQLKENEMLKVKLKQLAEQYVLSEQHHEQELKQKSLELQIADLKIKQHQEKVIQEQSQMKVYAEQVSQLLETEKNLRLQLTADGEKFQQFQDALARSNEVFETFKQEIEKMTKSIKVLKKENAFLKNKCDKSDITLIELVDERGRSKKQMEKLKNQKEKLESLCRSLQAERKQNPAGGNESDPSLGQNPAGGNESDPTLGQNPVGGGESNPSLGVNSGS